MIRLEVMSCDKRFLASHHTREGHQIRISARWLKKKDMNVRSLRLRVDSPIDEILKERTMAYRDPHHEQTTSEIK